MPYVERDQQGNVVTVIWRPQPNETREFLPDGHPDIDAFFSRVEVSAEQRIVADDVLDILISTNTITPADIPPELRPRRRRP